MEMTQCSVGHFYDSDEYASCPYCASALTENDFGSSSSFDRTSFQKSYEQSAQSTQRTVPGAAARPFSGRAVFPSSSNQSIFLDPQMEQKLVVGWLVALEGSCRGKSFELFEEAGTIGRSSQNQICIPNDPTVSRCAASIGFDPRSCCFYCRPQPGCSSIAFVNQEPLLQHTLLKKGDILTFGKTKLVLVPFCTKEFRW